MPRDAAREDATRGETERGRPDSAFSVSTRHYTGVTLTVTRCVYTQCVYSIYTDSIERAIYYLQCWLTPHDSRASLKGPTLNARGSVRPKRQVYRTTKGFQERLAHSLCADLVFGGNAEGLGLRRSGTDHASPVHRTVRVCATLSEEYSDARHRWRDARDTARAPCRLHFCGGSALLCGDSADVRTVLQPYRWRVGATIEPWSARMRFVALLLLPC